MEKQTKPNTIVAQKFHLFLGRIEKSRLFSKFGRKTWWIISVVALLMIVGGVAYFQMNSTDIQTAAADTLQITTARKGDLVIYASGTGTLVALDETDLLTAINGVSITIEAGEFVAIMDQSGSGKSTLMHILGCVSRPTSGEYFLDGENVSQLDKVQLAGVRNRKIGFIFQSYNLLAHSSLAASAS